MTTRSETTVSHLETIAVPRRRDRFGQVQVPVVEEEGERLRSLTCLPYFLITVVNHKWPLPIRDAERNYDRRRGRVQLIRNKSRLALG